MIDPRSVCLFIPNGLKKFKLVLFERIAAKIQAAGGSIVRGDIIELDRQQKIPIVGCTIELHDKIEKWRRENRPWIYWDRGYARRVFATSMPRGTEGGYYRWHLNSFQMQSYDVNTPSDRWDELKTPIQPWQKNSNGHVVVALLTPTYTAFHGLKGWTDNTLRAIAKLAGKRQIVVRDKEQVNTRPLQADLVGAYCLVTHGSMTAVEAVMCGCPVIVHPESAAAPMGLTELERIDRLVYPERQPWLNALAYTQFNEKELVDGTLWRLIR